MNPSADALERAVRHRDPARRPFRAADTIVYVESARLREILHGSRTTPDQAYDYLVDVTAVEYREPEPPLEVVYELFAFSRKVALRVKAELPKDQRAGSRFGRAAVGGRGLARAGGLRHVRHHVPRPSRPPPHPDVGDVCGRLSAAEGFPAARPVLPIRAGAPGARRESRGALLAGGTRRSRSPTRRPAADMRERLARRRAGQVPEPKEAATMGEKRTVELDAGTTGVAERGRPVPVRWDSEGPMPGPSRRRPRSAASTC